MKKQYRYYPGQGLMEIIQKFNKKIAGKNVSFTELKAIEEPCIRIICPTDKLKIRTKAIRLY